MGSTPKCGGHVFPACIDPICNVSVRVMDNLNIERALARLREIDARLKEVEQLQLERKEIVDALSVLQRYGAATDVEHRGVEEVSPRDQTGFKKNERRRAREGRMRKGQELGTPRPDGIPSVWEMTQIIISETSDQQATVSDIMKKIDARWWPGVHRNQVAPTIYKFAKNGRLDQVSPGTFAFAKDSASAGAEKSSAEEGGNLFGAHNSNPARRGA